MLRSMPINEGPEEPGEDFDEIGTSLPEVPKIIEMFREDKSRKFEQNGLKSMYQIIKELCAWFVHMHSVKHIQSSQSKKRWITD